LKFTYILGLIVLVLLLQFQVMAQAEGELVATTEGRSCWLFSAQLTGEKPILDLAKRFGNNARIGPSIMRKTKNNLLLGVHFDFIFGNKIVEDSVMWNLYTPSGFMIDNQGIPRNPGTFQRGYTVGIDVGKIFPVFQANSNSGLLWHSSYGFTQYRINIYDQDNGFAQFIGDYEKGYDRLTNGLYTEQMIGYAYLSKSKSANFIAGINVMLASTGGRRTWLYDVNRSGLDKRLEGTIGIKLLYMIPRYQKVVEETYY
jgi:hypothetical protein